MWLSRKADRLEQFARTHEWWERAEAEEALGFYPSNFSNAIRELRAYLAEETGEFIICYRQGPHPGIYGLCTDSDDIVHDYLSTFARYLYTYVCKTGNAAALSAVKNVDPNAPNAPLARLIHRHMQQLVDDIEALTSLDGTRG